MLKVGLTGGIATGKSYVLAVLGELGCETIDADAVAHLVIEPGQPAYYEIIRHFGSQILINTSGSEGSAATNAPQETAPTSAPEEAPPIDRAKLGSMIFADARQRERLNAIVHPRVFEWQSQWLAEVERRNPNAIAVIDAALMIETGSYRRLDKLVVVHCDPQLQLDRLMSRNNFNLAQAQARIAAQMPSEEKIKFADYTINTSNGFEDTRQQVEVIYRKLAQLRPAN